MRVCAWAAPSINAPRRLQRRRRRLPLAANRSVRCRRLAAGLFIGGIASLDHIQQLGITHVVVS